MKFDQTPAGQKQAADIVGAMRDGDLDRRNQVPSHYDDDGTPVYRVLLCGLGWVSQGKGTGCYRALDGLIGSATLGSAKLSSYREWAVGKNTNEKWDVVLHDDRPESPHIIASDLRTRGEACRLAEDRARRMPWIEGAPW